MPTYEYVCTSCGHEFETFQSMKADPLTDCPACPEGPVRRKIGRGAGIIFKGSGFYETDFKDRKGEKPKESSESGSKGENKAETKSETKAGGSDANKGSSSNASTSNATSNASASTSAPKSD